MLEHGGRLRLAALQYGIALPDWLDLSTGVAPYGLTLPDIPAAVWQRLPETEDGLEAAARDYYACGALLPVAGSQAAIQALPRLRRRSIVGMVPLAYAEHAAAWRRYGHKLLTFSEASINRALDRLDVMVLVNPNNPTGRLIEPEQLLAWHARLAERGGWLVVDEAFIDCTPELSLAKYSHLPGLIVLRSFGKFFGMAGARLGFVLAQQRLLQDLAEMLGPWPINGPTRLVATTLLSDFEGQSAQRQRLQNDAQRLQELLVAQGLPALGGCALFQWSATEQASQLFEYLANQGILLRHFEYPQSLRFGLPGDESGWQRLRAGLQAFNERQ
ncbi:threonine-phosphate decarboxylase CobD [Pseudomonas sp. EL_65y_Pfl2_R95]|uniref:threonine-phosphate decarboxylase CobD n=1 Tax=Pseudomonas sp. EL_65y_Pfl2_R95 TaxID=3088698 RepID=UPI0030DBBE36